jgi:AcrR family transcriptional regulator
VAGTKENILLTALRLFARDGYEAVSVSAIAGELGMTKGALYKHYKNKRDIFDSIVERMYQIDHERARSHEVPEEAFGDAPSAYRATSVEKFGAFTESQYRFWTEDEFACDFRKMLTLEQYRNPEMADLYQNCLACGMVDYTEDVFREMMADGSLVKGNPRLFALEYCAPLHLLISMSDRSADKEGLAHLLTAHIRDFIQRNTVCRVTSPHNKGA